jgi:hypothetical protein
MALSLSYASALLASAAALLEISDRTLRVQPDIEFELTARGGTGCIEWVSEDKKLAKVVGQKCEGDGELTKCEGDSELTCKTCCEGAASVARVRTIAPPPGKTQRWFTFIHANALDGKHDTIFCEVNVAPLDQLRVVTTVRQELHAHELQWLQLSAYDALPTIYLHGGSSLGNVFSPPALEALDVQWHFHPERLLQPVPPNETRQQLDGALAKAGDNWQRYHRLAVVAGSNTEAHPLEVRVSASVALSGGGRLHTSETLTIQPSDLRLVPLGRVALAPTMQVQFKLLTCDRAGTCQKKPHDSVGRAPDWSVLPTKTANVRMAS